MTTATRERLADLRRRVDSGGDDRETVGQAMEEELADLDAAIDRLDAAARRTTSRAHERAEQAIAELGQLRIAFAGMLADVRSESGAVRRDARSLVLAALDELERKAAATPGDDERATQVDPEREPSASALERLLRLLAVRGVVAIGFGVVLLAWPELDLATMTTLVGAFTLASGLVSGIAAYALPADANEHRVWLSFDALASYAVGIAVLVWPDLSASALLYAVGIWAIAVGGIQLGAAVLLPQGDVRSGVLWLSGVVIGVFGFVIFAAPGAGAVSLLALVAAFAIVSGVFDIALAVDLRRTTSGPKERPPQPVR